MYYPIPPHFRFRLVTSHHFKRMENFPNRRNRPSTYLFAHFPSFILSIYGELKPCYCLRIKLFANFYSNTLLSFSSHILLCYLSWLSLRQQSCTCIESDKTNIHKINWIKWSVKKQTIHIYIFRRLSHGYYCMCGELWQNKFLEKVRLHSRIVSLECLNQNSWNRWTIINECAQPAMISNRV